MFNFFKRKKIKVVIDDNIYQSKNNLTLLRFCLVNGINIEYKCQSGECKKCLMIEKTDQGSTSILACQRKISKESSNHFYTVK